MHTKTYLKKKLRRLDSLLHTYDLYKNKNPGLLNLIIITHQYDYKALDLQRKKIRQQLKTYKV